MAEAYPGTSISFTCRPISQLRDPILHGPRPDALQATIDVFRDAGTELLAVASDLQSALRTATEAHEGAAARASAQRIEQLVVPGIRGQAQMELAVLALQEQADHIAAVRREMEAVVPVDTSGREPPTPEQQEEWTRQQARAERALTVYQASTNANLASNFPVFGPPEGRAPDATPASATPAWGTGLGGPAPAAPVLPSAAVPDRPTSPHGPGVVPPGAGVPVPGRDVVAIGTPGEPVGAAAARTGTGTPSAPPPNGFRVGPAAAGHRVAPDLVTRSPAGAVPETGAAGSGATTARPHLPFAAPGRDGSAGRALRPGALLQPDLPRDPSVLREPPSRRAVAPLEARGGRASQATVEPRPRPGAAPVEHLSQAPGSGRGGSTVTHQPFVPGAGGAGQAARTHRRPDWLIEDDPDAYWLADLPAHGPAVLRPAGDLAD